MAEPETVLIVGPAFVNIVMCQLNEQVERQKKDVETPSRERVLPPGEKGKGILYG